MDNFAWRIWCTLVQWIIEACVAGGASVHVRHERLVHPHLTVFWIPRENSYRLDFVGKQGWVTACMHTSVRDIFFSFTSYFPSISILNRFSKYRVRLVSLFCNPIKKFVDFFTTFFVDVFKFQLSFSPIPPAQSLWTSCCFFQVYIAYVDLFTIVFLSTFVQHFILKCLKWWNNVKRDAIVNKEGP